MTLIKIQAIVTYSIVTVIAEFTNDQYMQMSRGFLAHIFTLYNPKLH